MNTDDHESVSLWLADMKRGDDAAVERIWQRYFTRLVGLARRNLAGSPRSDGLEEDVAQSAFKSFYFRARDGKFPRLADRDDLWKLLLTITIRKANRSRRRESRGTAIDPEALAAELAADTPRPEVAAAVADEVRHLMARLDRPHLADVALLKLQGLTNREVAQQVGVSVATVERKLQVIRHLWSDQS